jgi:hypothetical protein
MRPSDGKLWTLFPIYWDFKFSRHHRGGHVLDDDGMRSAPCRRSCSRILLTQYISGTMTDKEVKGAIRDGREADGMIRISHNLHAGRMEATAVRQRKGATCSAPVGHF